MNTRCLKSTHNIQINNYSGFGYNPSVDQQIINLIISRKILSISIVVNQHYSQQASQLIVQVKNTFPQIYRQLSIGLHFNLTTTNNLVFKEFGSLDSEKFGYFKQIEEVSQLIQNQFDNQVQKFIFLFKRRPEFIDNSQNIHTIPFVAKAIAQSMCQFGIYKVILLLNRAQNIQKVKDLYLSHSIICALESIIQTKQSSNNEQIESLNQKLLNGKNKISSYLKIYQKNPTKRASKLLIYSKLQKGTGNYTTTLRLKGIFQKMGYEVFTWSCQSQIQPQIEADDLQRFLINFGINLIIGINVSRSAKIIHLATHSSSKIRMKVPYILVVAGTDANYTFQNPSKYFQMKQCIYWSQCMVSLSNDMTIITQNVLKKLQIDKKVYTIVQSSSLKYQVKFFIKQSSIKQKYILFPTSFRRIKCVQHLFKELNWLIEKYHLKVLIVGPIIEKEYYQSIKNDFGKISYGGILNQQKYVQKLKDALLVINCSQTEGMSCSILEALQFGVPVIARNNAGNQQLINHNFNGLIYQTPQDFIDKFQLLLNNTSLRNYFIQNGKKIFETKYSVEAQIYQYQNLIRKQIQQKVMQMDINQNYIRVYNQSYVHNTSDVNNQLYLRIQPKVLNQISVLDLGCGTGIFGLIYLLKGQYAHIKLYLADINNQILGNALFNCRQSSIWPKIEIIAISQSDFFNNFDKNIQFDVILFNPPQTPFQNPLSRLDKNGGQNGIKFYQLVLKYFSQTKNKQLYLLHSYMAWPSKLNELLNYYKLKCIWKSEKRVHKIRRDDYDLMEKDLSSYILKHCELGRADICMVDNLFQIPAEIQLITKH